MADRLLVPGHPFRSRRRFGGLTGSMFLALALAPAIGRAGAYEDFFMAVRADNPDRVRSLIARGFDPNTIEPERGDTGLILALRMDATRAFEALLQAPGMDIEAVSQNGETALMLACFRKNRKAAMALLERGAEVNKTGWTPLHYAAAAGDNDMVQLLLERSAYIDAESPNKTTPIMMAARGGHIYTVKLLLDEGADATLKNELGLTAIDFAARHDHKDIVEGLTWRLKRDGRL